MQTVLNIWPSDMFDKIRKADQDFEKLRDKWRSEKRSKAVCKGWKTRKNKNK